MSGASAASTDGLAGARPSVEPRQRRAECRVPKKSSTVRRWLVALVVAAVLPTFIAALAAVLYAYKEEQQAFQQGLKDTTRALALVVDREIARREAIALTLAGSPTLTRGDLKAFYEYATQIAPTRDKVVVLHALDGQQLVNTRLPFGAPLPKSVIAAERTAAGPFATLVSNLYYAPVGRQHSFAVQVPVVREGRPIYYLSLAGFASHLQPIIDDQRLPAGWIASILDAKGVVVARNVAPERFVGQRTSDRLAAQLAQQSEGVFESKSIDGIPILATFSKSPVYGWAVVVGVPLRSVTGPLTVVAGFGALAAVLLAASLLAAVAVGRRLLVPVQRLRRASELLGSGQPLDGTPTGLAETDQVLAAMQAADQRIRQASQAVESRRLEAEEAAQALLLSTQRLQLATDASGLGLFTWQPDSDRLTPHNDRLPALLGFPAGEPPITASRFLAEVLHPEDRDRFAEALRRTLTAGAPFRFTGRIRRRGDGELRWIEFTGSQQQARPAEPIAIVGTAQDITDRLAAETALRENEARLRQLANTIPNLAWMADPDGWITWYNDRWYDYTGTTPEDMRGWGWQSVHDPAMLPHVMERWTESIRTGQPFEMTFPLRGKDGVFRPFFTRVAPLRDASGAIVQWFGTNTDVSPLKAAEQELREADRRKDEFIATLAHELRNPLAPIRTAAELLRRLATDEPQVARASQIIARQVSHMSGLLSDLLDVSRITRGLLTIERERVNVASVVAAALEQVRPLVEAKRHEVTVDQEDAAIEVAASQLRLTQVVANLLDNAAKYSDPGARIRVEVRTVGARVRIAVSDNGQGIAADLLPRVFEPFTQAQRGSQRSQGGLGLGLAVVRGLVELQGGHVSAHSDGPGRGSRFEIELPVFSLAEESAPSAAPATALAGDPASPGGSLDILVVDDNVDAADTLVALLKGLGHRTACAYSGAQALAAMRQRAFDAAILDIGLPDMSGYALAAFTRQGGLPVGTLIALSGYGQEQDRDASFAAGFAHHLVKPVEPGALVALLATLRPAVPAAPGSALPR